MDTMIRNIPENHHAAVQRIASVRGAGVTQNQVYLEIIADWPGAHNPAVVIAWVRGVRPGECECVKCDGTIAPDEPFLVALRADGSAEPYHEDCAP